MAKTPEAEELMRKYLGRLEAGLGEVAGVPPPPTKITTVEYEEFKKEYMPKRFSIYEKACQFSERVIRIRPDEKKLPAMQEAIRICHLNVTPSGVASFAILGPIIFMLVGIMISYMLPVILGRSPSMFFMGFFVIAGVALISPLNGVPAFLANSWRMKASNQMVLCVFYVATYMRHTSNLENGIGFAAEHLAPPLSLDLKKVLWDVESGKYASIKESLDMYLATWKRWNMEFIESFHLLESSLYEAAEDRRVGMLDKALSVILEETYEKMLHYAQNLKSPITMLHMLGVILPILGLVILPLMVSFMCGVKWYQLAMLYNVALPIGVFYLGKKILSTRPTGYGDTDISEENPELRKYRNILIRIGKTELKLNPLYLSVIIGIVLLLIGLTPMMLHVVQPEGWDMILKKTVPPGESAVGSIMTYKDPNAMYYFLGYKRAKGCEGVGVGDIVGPYGLGASLLSIFIPLSLAFGLGYNYKLRSKNVVKIRAEAKALEKEFASALFQLGNRLGDGLPAEIAFAKVAGTMEGTISGSFFALVTQNIRRLGMSVEQAIFDPRHGALVQYPSKLIESSMKVLVESAKKGPRIAAQALVNVSRYIKEIHRVNERLKDLMADIISSMRSQIAFLTPAIAGIVVGITSMITAIIGKLSELADKTAAEGGVAGQENVLASFGFGDGIPTFYFQLIVGFYVVQIIYILTILVNGIENGSDKLNERYLLGLNLTKRVTIFALISIVVMMLFNIIAATIIAGIAE